MSGTTFVYAAIGLAIAVLGLPLWMRRIRPNRLYGVRTSVTFADKTAWYKVNAAAGLDMVIIGSLTCTLALVLDACGVAGDAYSLIMGCVIMFGAGAIAVSGLSRCRGARRHDGTPGENRHR